MAKLEEAKAQEAAKQAADKALKEKAALEAKQKEQDAEDERLQAEAKAKREADDKAVAEQEAAEKKRIADQQADMEAEELTRLRAASLKRADEILDSDPEEREFQIALNKAPAAIDAARKLRTIALDYQQTTPNEHVVFGRGNFRFTVGDLRDLFGLPKP